MPQESVAERVAAVRERIARACARAGRSPGDVRLVAVGKTQPAALIGEAMAAGVTAFGENYVREAEEKIRAYPGAEWHLIGKLQGNKAKKAVSMFSWIQSGDSLRILSEISRRSVEAGKVMPVLVEVNLAGEEAKAGVSPEALPHMLEAALEMPGVRLSGLMAIPPLSPSPEGSRPYFARLRDLLGVCAGRGGEARGMKELSMGMSHDFDVAIEEGATMVRIGTAIFGSRARRRG
jgi:PLP dependent protein